MRAPIAGTENTHLKGDHCTEYHRSQYQMYPFSAREGHQTESVNPYEPLRLIIRSDKGNLSLIGATLLTFCVSLQLRPETRWVACDIWKLSRRGGLLRRLGRFFALYSEEFL